MAADIDFYFDFSSPYGYFASTRIDELAQRYGRRVNWHPVLLGVVFKTSGAQPLTMVPLKGEYSIRDFVRTARFHGIPFNMPPKFPIASVAAARAMLWLQKAVGAQAAVGFAKAVYRAFFVDGIDVGEANSMLRIAAQQGIDTGALAAGIEQPEIKEQLKTEVEQAMLRGVFGSPYIIVDGEPFWGFDRFDQLEALLKNGSI
ncbi:MAG: 2-hydroxychromene-2-carboxylate isomerase [Burkholderiaceae bacterium]|nr:2-hydroxychromene-2-carboxylate isomerase [Burkholderiaceae bacterium]